jgi:magnesium transporter
MLPGGHRGRQGNPPGDAAMAMRLLTLDSKIDDTTAIHGWIEAHPSVGTPPEQECAPFWLDIIEPDEQAVDWLESYFHFHPLTIEDLRSPNERGKIESYEGYLFIIAHSVYVEGPPQADGRNFAGSAPHDTARALPRDTSRPAPQLPGGTRPLALLPSRKGQVVPAATEICDVDSYEIHAYLGKNYLITVHEAQMHCVDKIWAYADRRGNTGDPHPLQHGPDYLLYHILDSAVDTYFVTLQETADQIDFLENAVIDRPERRLLEDVFTVKRNLVTIRRLAIPMREAMNILSSDESPYVQPPNRIYMRDVHNLLVAVAEQADTQRDSSSGVLDAYLSSVNNNLSQIMKRMTIIATIFMPISFIASFGGMNFINFIPYDNPVMFWGLIASMVALPVAMFLWFRRNQWT